MAAATLPRAGVLWAALLVLPAAAHAPALAGGFVWDDRVLVLESPRTRELAQPREYLASRFWSGSLAAGGEEYYRPLTALSFALDFALFGERAAGFHATNLLAHLACTALVFRLARRAGSGAAAAALAALLFALFPRLTESVSWISGRGDPLAALGVLGALALHRSEPAAWPARACAAGALLAGLLCKEIALAGVVALAAYEAARWRAGAPLAAAARNLAPAVVALLIYLALRMGVAPARATSVATVAPVERVLLALEALGAYAAMLIDPLRPRLRIGLLGSIDPVRVCLGAATLALATACGLAFRRRALPPALWAAVALAPAALLPVLQLVPLAFDALAADRFLYLPLAALAVALAPLAERLRGGAVRAVAGVALAAVAPFAVATALRAADWADELVLWEQACAQADPADARPALMLGETLLRRGRPAEALASLERAEKANRARVRVEPWADVGISILGNRALALAALGRDAEALPLLQKLASREPGRARHRYNLAVLALRQGDLPAARAALAQALELAPADPAAQRLRGALADSVGAGDSVGEAAQSGPEPSSSPSFSKR